MESSVTDNEGAMDVSRFKMPISVLRISENETKVSLPRIEIYQTENRLRNRNLQPQWHLAVRYRSGDFSHSGRHPFSNFQVA